MELLFASLIGVLTASGVLLLLRKRSYSVLLGLTLLSYAVNLFIFASGGLTPGQGTILGQTQQYADPLPQALVLTAIVIGFAMTAFALVLAIRLRVVRGTDRLDDTELEREES